MVKKISMAIMLLLVFILILNVFLVYAHGGEDESDKAAEESFEEPGTKLKQQAFWVIVIASVVLILLVITSIIFEKSLRAKSKYALFFCMAAVILASTAYSAGTTIYLNTISESGGPVHWHADFEIWKCDEKIDLKDPKGFSNRVGSPVFHEHGDDRIHVEGVVVDTEDVELHHFFQFVGGDLTANGYLLPINGGFITAKNGEECGYNKQPGKVQVFAYRVVNPEEKGSWRFEQRKIEDFESFVIAPYGNVPPGDCVIIEFDADKERTDKICGTYQSAIERGEMIGG